MAQPSRKIIQINKERQEGSNYCYAAVLKAVVQLYEPKTPISQGQICSFYQRGGPQKNEIQDPIDYLQSRGMLNGDDGYALENSTPIPDNVVVNEINNGRPIIVFVDNGHYVLLHGYEGNYGPRGFSRNGGNYVFYDPIEPDKQKMIKSSDAIFYSNYESGKKDVPLSINGYYLTQPPTVTHSDALASFIAKGGAKKTKKTTRKATKRTRKATRKATRKTTKRHGVKKQKKHKNPLK